MTAGDRGQAGGGGKRKKQEQEEIVSTLQEIETASTEKLYSLGVKGFIQYNGCGGMPPDLATHVVKNGGEMPPHMPLPAGPTEFRLEADTRHGIAWSGTGPLPHVVMEYVNEHGMLPRYVSCAPDALLR